MTNPVQQAQRNFAIASAMVVAGAFVGVTLLLQVFGVLEVADAPGPAARLLTGLFASVLLLVACWQAVKVLTALAGQRGARSMSQVATLAVNQLAERVTRDSAMAAAALLPLLWQYRDATHGDAAGWGPTPEGLEALVSLEFLLIHGFVFMVFAATLIGNAARKTRALGWALLTLLGALYAAFAWGFGGGIGGVLGLGYLMLPNVLAFARRQDPWTLRATAVARWAIKCVCFFGVATVLDERSLQGAGNLSIGLYYFTSQFLVELFRLADIPLDLGALWARLPAGKRQQLSLGVAVPAD